MTLNLPGYVQLNPYALIAAVEGLLFLSLMLGYLIGRRRRLRGVEATQIGTIEGASLGLLALLLGFSFSMAINRYDNRRAVILAESNAIGTAALRAEYLPEPHRAQLVEILRQYTSLRVEFYNTGGDLAKALVFDRQAVQLQAKLWKVVTALVQARDTPTTAAFIVAANEVIDLQAARLENIEDRIPGAIVLLLVITGIGSLAIAGYSAGLSGGGAVGPLCVASLLIALVLLIILDLDRPRKGLIRSGQDSMTRLQAGMTESATSERLSMPKAEPPAADR